MHMWQAAAASSCIKHNTQYNLRQHQVCITIVLKDIKIKSNRDSVGDYFVVLLSNFTQYHCMQEHKSLIENFNKKINKN